jgi:HAE1 family hydrophobic/amphiphilic exporter-1
MSIPSFSVKNPVKVTMFFAGVMLMGIICLFLLPIELMQSSGRGVISIVIYVRGGMPPQEVEDLITRPTEEAVSTTNYLRTLYSHTREAESRVTMEFEPGINLDYASVEVREKFATVRDKLPREVEKPIIAKFDEADQPIFIASISSRSSTPEEIRQVVDNILKPQLARISGVANVEIYGGRERKILVELDQAKMQAYEVPIERVMNVLGANNLNLLAGGVEAQGLNYSIRALGEFENIQDVGEVGVATTKHGMVLKLKEIAKIQDNYLEPQDYARFNLDPNVSLYIKKESEANTLAVTSEIARELKEFERNLKNKARVRTIGDQGKIILRAVNDLRDALVLGCILAMVVIYIFLRDWRSTWIVSLSIPISILATFIFMFFLGQTLNVMTLSGLALASGDLVDCSIIVLENIFKKKQSGLKGQEAVIVGSEEVWKAILGSAMTTVLVFLPILFIDKEIQLKYQGISFTVTASLMASLFVSLSLIPMLSGRLSTESVESPAMQKVNLTFKKLQKKYRQLLDKSVRMKSTLFLAIGLLLAIAIWGLGHKGFDLPSRYQENEFAVVVFPPAGASLETTDQVMHGLEDILYQIRDVQTIATTVKKVDPRLFVTLKPKAERKFSKKATMEEVKTKANEMAKKVHKDYSVIADEGTATSGTKELVLNIYGLENDTLEKLAHAVAQQMGSIPGLTNVVMTDLRKRPEYNLVVNKRQAALFGFTVKDIAESLHASIRGMRPTKYHSEGSEIETITRLQASDRKTIEDIKNIILQTPSGEPVYLRQIVDFVPVQGPTTVDRKDKYRYVFVKANITKGDMQSTAKALEELLKKVEFPKDYFWRFGGEYPTLMKGKTQLLFAIMITILLIYMTLAALFQSYLQPLVILISVPLAIIGVWIALFITREPLSELVLLGIVMMTGVVVRNPIVMIDHMNYLTRERGVKLLKAVILSGQDRMRPILMTTAATVLGFLPLALGLSESADLWSPLAVTVIGGLISSTFLTLFVIPNLYILFNRFSFSAFISRYKPLPKSL